MTNRLALSPNSCERRTGPSRLARVKSFTSCGSIDCCSSRILPRRSEICCLYCASRSDVSWYRIAKHPSYDVQPQSNLAAALALASRRAWLAPRFRNLLQHGGEHLELLRPVLAVAVDPDRHRENRPRDQAASADPTGALLLHQPGPH